MTEEETKEVPEQKIEELQQEREQLLQAETALRDELARLERERSEALDGDDVEILQAALSNKPLKKSSSLRKAMDRLDEMPHQIYALRRRYLQISIELFELEQEQLERESAEAREQAFEASAEFEKARENYEWAQHVAVAASEDVRTKGRATQSLRNQLAEHEANKPSTDRIEAELARRKVWREG